MHYRKLGATELVVSEIGFGAWGIGGRSIGQTSYGDTDDAVSLTALERAIDCGITFIDTSPAYGAGHSEELIGRALAGRRREVVVATKAGYEDWARPADFSPAAIRRSVEASLRRLRTGHIDLLQLHNPPSEVLALPETRQALVDLVTEGKVRSWGVSAKSPQMALEALRVAGAPLIQANFNMMDVRALTSGLLDEVASMEAGFIARTPLCFGFLSGTIGRTAVFPPGDHRLGWSRAQLDNWIDGAADLLQAVGAAPGEEGALAALRFCLSFPAVTTTIPGILRPGEAESNARAGALGPLPAPSVEAVLEINRRREFFVAPARAS
jgi:aryl-alcohol dehydrogenase-like predicted oxidoreductase